MLTGQEIITIIMLRPDLSHIPEEPRLELAGIAQTLCPDHDVDGFATSHSLSSKKAIILCTLYS